MAGDDPILVPYGVNILRRPGDTLVQAPRVDAPQTPPAATTPPSQHPVQPTTADKPAAASRPATAKQAPVEAPRRLETTETYRPTAFQPATRARPNAELTKLAHQHGGVIAESTPSRMSTQPQTSARQQKVERTVQAARREAERVSASSGIERATVGADAWKGRHLASTTPPPGYPDYARLPKPRKLGQIALSSGVSAKVPIPPHQIGQYEVSGHLRAAAQLKWRGGKGKTEVALDPSSHSISIEHGPLSLTDFGQLSDRLRSVRHPTNTVSGHHTLHPFTVDLSLGAVDLGGRTHKVVVTTHVATEGLQKVVSIDASTEVVENVRGYGRITLEYSLVADLTLDRREKKRQRPQIYDNLPVDVGALVVALVALGGLQVVRRETPGF